MLQTPPRVAFFTDCFHEVNGVALTSRQLDGFARKRALPFLSVHAGPVTRVQNDGAYTSIELKRSLASVPLDAGMHFDVFAPRHFNLVRRELVLFQPDLIHITGPGDCGLLGAILAWNLGVPLVASWHTNLHEFGARRLERVLGTIIPKPWALKAGAVSERWMLKLLNLFYGSAQVLLAPNPELIAMLKQSTHKPTFLMQRGVDTNLYSPQRRHRTDDVFTIGYVGRLSPEKNVRVLVDIERQLESSGLRGLRFLIVGQGSQREWLEQNLQHAVFTGVLSGLPLAEAYASMDVFAFPSETDTFGNVVQEALASGLPTLVAAGGGPKFLIQPGVTGFVCHDAAAFAAAIAELVRNPANQREMSVSARKHALEASWDAVFQKVYTAYELATNSIITTDASGTRSGELRGR